MNHTVASGCFGGARLRFIDLVLGQGVSYLGSGKPIARDQKGNFKPDSICTEVSRCVRVLKSEELLSVLLMWWRCLRDFGFGERIYERLERYLMGIFWERLKRISDEKEIRFVQYLWQRQLSQKDECLPLVAVETTLYDLASQDKSSQKGNLARTVLGTDVSIFDQSELKSRSRVGYVWLRKRLRMKLKLVRPSRKSVAASRPNFEQLKAAS